MTSSIEMPIIMTITRKTMSMSTTPMMSTAVKKIWRNLKGLGYGE